MSYSDVDTDADDTLDFDESDNESVATTNDYTTEGRTPYAYTRFGFRQVMANAIGKKYGGNQKNGEIVEKHTYNATIKLCQLKGYSLKTNHPNFQTTYASLIYNVLSSKENIKTVIEKLTSGKVEWKEPIFQPLISSRSAEEADHTKDVVEGIHECSDCKSKGKEYKKTRNVQIQTRGGDEGMTVFVTCVGCRKMWKQYN